MFQNHCLQFTLFYNGCTFNNLSLYKHVVFSFTTVNTQIGNIDGKEDNLIAAWYKLTDRVVHRLCTTTSIHHLPSGRNVSCVNNITLRNILIIHKNKIYSVIKYFKNALPTIIIRTETSTLLISNVNKISDCCSGILICKID